MEEHGLTQEMEVEPDVKVPSCELSPVDELDLKANNIKTIGKIKALRGVGFCSGEGFTFDVP